MTTSIVWPSALPCFRFEPYNVSPRWGATEITLGMATKRARVYTENNEIASVELILSSTQEQALRTFFKTTTAMGTQSFLVPVLVGGSYAEREATFYGAPPSFTPVADGYVRSAFQILVKNEAIPEPPPPETAYDPIVLARNPWGYWRFDDVSPTTAFYDRTGNGNSLIYTGGGITYEQGALNLDDPASSIGRTDVTTSWRLRVNANAIYDNGVSVTVGGWVRFYNDSPTTIKTLFQIGGTGGSAQFYYLWCYRDASGNVAMSWHHHIEPSGPNVFITKTFATALPLDTIFWFEAGFDYDNTRAFFKLNDGAYEYQSWDGTDSPNGLDHTSGRVTYFHVGQRPVGTSGEPIDGQFSHVEAYARFVALDMWTDWHL